MDCIELTRQLIRIKSDDQAGANRAIDFCREWLSDYGIDAVVLENSGYKSLVAKIGQGPATLVLNGHVDVVGGKEEQFEPYVKDGNLYGRGAADMKAGVAVFLTAVSGLKDDPMFDPSSCTVLLQIVSDEETGGKCSRFLADSGYLGDFVICGEPTQLDLGVQAKGILQVDLFVRGKAGHGSRPWEGENAIVKAFALYSQIMNLPFTRESTALYPAPSLNLAMIEAGSVYNKIPDLCRLSLDIRYLPGQKPEDILAQIRELGAEVAVHSCGDPVTTRPDDAYVRALAAVVSRNTLREAMLFGQHGASDARFFSRRSIPAVEFGPAGNGWHGDDEYVNIGSVLTYEKIIKEYVDIFGQIFQL